MHAGHQDVHYQQDQNDGEIVVLADSGFSALEFLAALLRQEITCVTRLRLDAALYEPAPPRRPGDDRTPADQGRAPADPGRGAGRPRPRRWQRVTVPDWYGEGERIVEIGSGHRRLAPQRPAGRADPLGAAARSLQALRPAGPALHRPARRSRCRSSAGSSSAGSSKSPSARCATTSASRPSGSGRTRPSPAPRPACSGCSRSSTLLACPPRPPYQAPGLGQRLVPQAAANLRRQPRRSTTRDLERAGFRRVPAVRRAAKLRASPPRGHRLRPLPRRLNGQSRAKTLSDWGY